MSNINNNIESGNQYNAVKEYIKTKNNVQKLQNEIGFITEQIKVTIDKRNKRMLEIVSLLNRVNQILNPKEPPMDIEKIKEGLNRDRANFDRIKNDVKNTFQKNIQQIKKENEKLNEHAKQLEFFIEKYKTIEKQVNGLNEQEESLF